MKKIVILFVLVFAMYHHTQIKAQTKLKTKNGLEYIVLTTKLGAKKGKIGDFAKINVTLKNYKDSLIFERLIEKEPIKDAQKGDITEIMQYMAEGDSILCIVSADTLFKNAPPQQRPAFFPTGTDMKYYLKMYSIKTMEEIKAAEEEKIKTIKLAETAKIKEYALKNKLQLMSTPSGLHYVITKKNPIGVQAKGVVNIAANYTGQLLNGIIFDTSIKEVAQKAGKFTEGRPYEPLKFTLGKGQVIKGWDEGLALLRTGEKAILLIPSYLAYGQTGAGKDIPANSILRFDVELTQVEIDATKKDEVKKEEPKKDIIKK
ncbi:MAG: FKBP-type peptidyl-prolyl cis-trans isomerase [Cytophagia bacterium]|nr:MAG: FKBP-type peptidyl-prolyl cis-trans isomerase [Cytophagia bacterium]TAG44177.1 MAG: FKBP-type peptidyl-prolyl cis-trans isomerase [Cytophagia bacterium]TAH29565.1 MAG: FKBP-type peptidyl-prolyl cis-trans isomerase [Cytophagales bacterium]